MTQKYVTVEQEENYFDVKYGLKVDIEHAMYFTPNYFVWDEKDDDRIEIPNIKKAMIDDFKIDSEVITNYSKYDFASGGRLPMPCPGESVNVRIVRPPRRVGVGAYVGRCVIYGRETDLQYDIHFSSHIVKGMLSEFEKNHVPIDDKFLCVVNRIFTIVGKLWYTATKELWIIDDVTKRPVPPKVYSVALRQDLECSMADPASGAPDLMRI